MSTPGVNTGCHQLTRTCDNRLPWSSRPSSPPDLFALFSFSIVFQRLDLPSSSCSSSSSRSEELKIRLSKFAKILFIASNLVLCRQLSGSIGHNLFPHFLEDLLGAQTLPASPYLPLASWKLAKEFFLGWCPVIVNICPIVWSPLMVVLIVLRLPD